MYKPKWTVKRWWRKEQKFSWYFSHDLLCLDLSLQLPTPESPPFPKIDFSRFRPSDHPVLSPSRTTEKRNEGFDTRREMRPSFKTLETESIEIFKKRSTGTKGEVVRMSEKTRLRGTIITWIHTCPSRKRDPGHKFSGRNSEGDHLTRPREETGYPSPSRTWGGTPGMLSIDPGVL